MPFKARGSHRVV